MNPTTIQIAAAALFALALIHSFSTKRFEMLAHAHPRHGGLLHLLGEVEVVFGLWAGILLVFFALHSGAGAAVQYLDTRNYTEPLFVFAIMVVAASRPVLSAGRSLVRMLATVSPLAPSTTTWLALMTIIPLLGSLITEPAAMTLAALMLREQLTGSQVSTRFRYATLGALFVNISIGGTLTNFAAPPVLMVASVWQWDSAYMLTHFGWKAALAVSLNAVLLALVFRRDLALLAQREPSSHDAAPRVPASLIALHIALLAGIVVGAHHPPVFIGLMLAFLGLAKAYPQHQDRLVLPEALLVAFFLAGLVVLGGLQQWWLEPVLLSMSTDAVFFGAAALTAFTDNAALTYLGAQVSGLTPEFQRALVAGAVAGGGMTVIANAPNPAGMAILRESFPGRSVSPLGLAAAAAVPTLVALAAFRLL